MHASQDDHRLDLHDDALLRRLRSKLAQERCVTAEVLRLMAEVDLRRLYAQAACESMFAFATRMLGMSESTAYKRIAVARAGRRFPAIFDRVGAGRVHLSGLCVLVPHLTANNQHELLDAASGLSKRAIERLVAERFPKPDVPTSLRKQPTPSQTDSAKRQVSPPPGPPPGCPARTEQQASSEVPTPSAQQTAAQSNTPAQTDRSSGNADTGALADDVLTGTSPSAAGPDAAVVHSQKHPQPLSAERYLLKVTLSAQLRDKLRQSQDLLGTQVPTGDIATVLEYALDALIAQQLKKKYAVGAKARRAPDSPQTRSDAPTASNSAQTTEAAAAPRSRAIPAAIRRAVYQRDGGQCRFVDPKTAQRCQARTRLHMHHDIPFAKAGAHSVDNVLLLCAAHNDYVARQDYGHAHIQGAIDASRAKDSPMAAPTNRSNVPTVPGRGRCCPRAKNDGCRSRRIAAQQHRIPTRCTSPDFSDLAAPSRDATSVSGPTGPTRAVVFV